MIPQIEEQAKDITFLNWYYLTFIPETTKKVLGKSIPNDSKRLIGLIAQLSPVVKPEEWDRYSDECDGIRSTLIEDFFQTKSILDQRMQDDLQHERENEEGLSRRIQQQRDIFSGFSLYHFSSLLSNQISTNVSYPCEQHFEFDQEGQVFLGSLFEYGIYQSMKETLKKDYREKWNHNFKSKFDEEVSTFNLIRFYDELYFNKSKSFENPFRSWSPLGQAEAFITELGNVHHKVETKSTEYADQELDTLIRKEVPKFVKGYLLPYLNQVTDPRNWSSSR